MFTFLERGGKIPNLPSPPLKLNLDDALEHLSQLERLTGVLIYEETRDVPGVASYLMAGYHKDNPGPNCKPQLRWIEVYNAEDDPELYYWVTLHEFAHVLNGDAETWAWNDAYDWNPGPFEARAWLRALQESVLEPSERVLDEIYYTWFGSYTASPLFNIEDPDIAALFHYLEVETVE